VVSGGQAPRGAVLLWECAALSKTMKRGRIRPVLTMARAGKVRDSLRNRTPSMCGQARLNC